MVFPIFWIINDSSLLLNIIIVQSTLCTSCDWIEPLRDVYYYSYYYKEYVMESGFDLGLANTSVLTTSYMTLCFYTSSPSWKQGFRRFWVPLLQGQMLSKSMGGA